ncbi:MAG: aminotransferase class V-fold PLP-dependent enzyme [Alphaproteobacteria bacterium]|nr:aminotransferase class V-fold PLP-dependent enzyme [Alphaproteobacteria bacterium]
MTDAPPPRRALDRAALSSPSAAVRAAVASGLARARGDAPDCSELPAALARLLGLPGRLVFRHNATLALRDLALVQRVARGATAGVLVCTDAEHPAVRHVLETVWRGAGPVVALPIQELSLADDDVDAALARGLAQAVAQGPVDLVVLPHVLWFNGAVVDVARHAVWLAQHAPDAQVVVDGAQAVGNIALAPGLTDAVHAYVGCTHKWLGGPQTLGFVELAPALCDADDPRAGLLASGDVLPELGALSGLERGSQCGTQRRAVAAGTLVAVEAMAARPGGLPGAIAASRDACAALRRCLERAGAYTVLGPRAAARSSMVAFCRRDGDEAALHGLADRLDGAGFVAARYRLDGHGAFLRLSPGPDLTPDDLDAFGQLVLPRAASSVDRLAPPSSSSPRAR